jgi:hypothetical protein
MKALLLVLVGIVASEPLSCKDTSKRRVSMYFYPDNPISGTPLSYAGILKQAGGSDSVTSLIIGCGHHINDSGQFVQGDRAQCRQIQQTLAAMGICTEHIIQSTSLKAMHALFSNPQPAMEAIANMSASEGIQGVSWDVEPDGSVESDCEKFRKFLGGLGNVMPPAVRVTTYTNDFAKIIKHPEILHTSVDRIIGGETYTGESGKWIERYHELVTKNVPRKKVSVAMATSVKKGPMNCEVAELKKHLAQIEADYVPEITIFSLNKFNGSDSGEKVCGHLWFPLLRQFLNSSK